MTEIEDVEDEPFYMINPRKRDMGDKSTEEYWTSRVEQNLVGKKIVKVEFMNPDSVKKNGWGKRPICFLLDDGNWIYPMMDDEANDGGVMGTTYDKLDTIPVL
jgi:hypothetical protein